MHDDPPDASEDTVHLTLDGVPRATPRQACLVVISGSPDLSKRYELRSGVTTIGRAADNDIRIDHASVSRRHAQIHNTGDGVVFGDLGSKNGSYVNDALCRGDRCKVRDGDRLGIGQTIFKLLACDDLERAYHDEVYRMASLDALTQVYNKRYFRETLEREVARARRHGRPLSLILIDIDHFKRINDRLGHAAGDEALRALAETLRASVRQEDLVARYGGEEFAVLLPETDREQALALAERLRGLVEEARFEWESEPVVLTVSAGVACARAEAGDADTLFREADDRLYDSKRAGRNRVAG